MKMIMGQVILTMELLANVGGRRVPVSILPRFRLLHRNQAVVAEEEEEAAAAVGVSNAKNVLTRLE